MRITGVWIFLILATGLSWQFGHGFGFGDRVHYATAAILVITFVKIRFRVPGLHGAQNGAGGAAHRVRGLGRGRVAPC